MKLLLIEDEREVAEYVGKFLREAGFELAHASSGAEARRHAAESRFDLILLDLVLPDILGRDLLPELKTLAPSIPVIIVSGLSFDDENLLECLKNGAAGYVPKSSRAEELLTAVRRALRE